MVKVGEKNTQTRKRSKVSSQERKVDCGTVLVNAGSETGWRNTAHPMDRAGQQVHWQVLVQSGPVTRYLDCQFKI